MKRLHHFSGWTGLTLGFLFSLTYPTVIPAQTIFTNGVTTVVTTNFLGWATNGPVIFQISRLNYTNTYSESTNGLARPHRPNYSLTNLVFHGFQPHSLSYAIWTNFIAHTNGRQLKIWSERIYRATPDSTIKLKWNTNGLMWGMKGLTALSPHCQADLGTGQSPITALTRRHGYTRGHGAGTEGFTTNRIGLRVWFVTTENRVVEVKIKQSVVRTRAHGDADYMIVLFDRDLPATIQPLRVTTYSDVRSKYPFPDQPDIPHPLYMTEQFGNVSTSMAPWVVDIWKGGDSGCPNLIPLPGELIFINGRSTTGPTPEMQADMDTLCRMEKLDPRKYQLQWVDLSKYPAY